MKNLITLLALFIFPAVQAQYTKTEAKIDLHNLKNGVLLIRLHTNQASIAALESRGRQEEADKLKEQLYLKNKEILLSFKNAFDYCPVYFFYAQSTEAVRKGQFEGILFDYDRLPVSAGKITGKVYTAEFSETTNLGIEGFVLMNDQLFPLKSPFPFFQRKHIALGLIKLSKAKMVEQYNKRLHDTYKLWFQKGKKEESEDGTVIP